MSALAHARRLYLHALNDGRVTAEDMSRLIRLMEGSAELENTSHQHADELVAAIRDFETALPGWWFTIGSCSVSRDASCGPDRQGPDAALLRRRLFDDGFHVDLHDGSLADALREATRLAVKARKHAVTEPKNG